MRPYKFIVQTVLQICDEEGNVVGEAEGQPVPIYGYEALKEWTNEFPKMLAELNANRKESLRTVIQDIKENNPDPKSEADLSTSE